jgi:tetratricopeptide (TPR) repeat protein
MNINNKTSFTLLFVFISVALAQTSQIDSLKSVLSGATGKGRLIILYDLANQLEMSYPKEALEYARDGISLAGQLADSSSLATLYSSAGYSCSELGDFEQSLQYGYTSLEIATLIGDKKKIASANSTLGITYVYMGQFSTALEHHLTALRLREELGLQVAIIRTLNNIGIVYHNIGQYDKAIEYYTMAYEKQKAISPDDESLVRFLVNIGFSEFKRGNISRAMKYHTDALALAEKIHYNGVMAYTLFNLGIMNAALQDFEKALDYLHRSLKIYEGRGEKYGTTEVLNALGSTYYKMGKYDLAIQYLRRAVVLADQVNAPSFLKSSYETLYSVYEAKGETAKAFRYYKLYSAEKDSLYNSAESKKIAELSIRMEIDTKEREIDLLKKEKTISELTLEKERSQIRSIAGVVVLLIALIVLLYLSNRKTKMGKLFVDQKNDELKLLNEELQEKISEVKVLGGLLPICANCKKIRDDKGYWKQLEEYISHHSEATFSHSICPSCMKELYPDISKNMK